MTTSPFDPLTGEDDDELQHLLGPFGAASRPVPSPFVDSLLEVGAPPGEQPAHVDQLAQPSTTSGGPWSRGPFAEAADAPFGTGTAHQASEPVQPPDGVLAQPVPAGVMTPFGLPAPAASDAQAVVPLPRSSPDSRSDALSHPPARAAGPGSRRRVSPVLAVAVAGGAVLAGALGAFALLGASDPADGADTAAVLVPAPASTAAPTDPGAVSGGGASPSAAPTAVPAAAFAPNARDPFAALVAGGAAAAPATATGAPAVVTGAGTTTGTTAGAGDGSTGTTGRGGTATTGGTTTGNSTGGTTTGGTSTGGTTTGGTTGGTATQLTKAQVCTAVADPVNQLEQVLTASSTGAQGAVDAGLALRNPVAVLRTAVSLTSDSRLAGRLDIAASTAEALRAQLIAGTAVTAGQVATQVSRDADVRSACA